MVKSKITEAGCRRGLGCGLLKFLFHPIPQHPVHNSGGFLLLLGFGGFLFLFFPHGKNNVNFLGLSVVVVCVPWVPGCSGAGCWAGSPGGWQQVALQFKGIAVEGFHNTPDRDAKVGVARHWEQEGPVEIKKYIYKNQSLPIADQY